MIAELLTVLVLARPDATLSRISSEYVGRPVSVWCDPGVHGGTAGGDDISLDVTFCNPLRALEGDVHVALLRQGVGLITLAHEALHLLGVPSEARAECLAFQEVDEVARLFGLRPSPWRRRVISAAYADHFDLIRQNHLYRNRRRCRQDGDWDLSPYDGRWP